MIGIFNNWFTGLKARNRFSKWSYGASWESEKRTGLWFAEIQWYLFFKAKELTFMLGVGNSYAGSYHLHIGIPFLFNVYLKFKTSPNFFTKWAGGDAIMGGRETGFSFSNNYLNLRFARFVNGWDADKFCGWSYIKTWGELLRGDHDAEMVGVGYASVECALKRSKNYPEGLDRVLFHSTTERYIGRYSRWYLFWYRYNYTRITLEPTIAIIVPGKGDNGWDQGDETMGKISFGRDTLTLEAAANKYMESVERHMRR